MQKLRISLEPQAHAVRAIDGSAQTRPDKAVLVEGQRPAGGPMRNDRPAQHELAVSVAARAKLRLHEHRVVAVVFEVNLPERKRGGIRSALASQHHAREVAERIEIEQEGSRAMERRRRLG